VSAQAKKIVSDSEAVTEVAAKKGNSAVEAAALSDSANVVPINGESDISSDEHSNLIKRTVEADGHDLRENLIAKGVQFHMLNALVELGVQEKFDEQAVMMETAIEASVKAHGSHAVTPKDLDESLKEIVGLEKDLRHVRYVASQQGVHMLALNHLTQMMKANPGDGGVQAINTFVAYADAAGIPLDRLGKIREQFADTPKSVLPDIPRETETDRKTRIMGHINNVIVGLALTAVMVWMVL